MGFFSTLGDTREMLLYILTMVLMLGFIMPVHECAHGLMAKALGDDTAERAGRLTLNPMAHLNLYGALLMFLIGFGWANPVPVSPVRFRNQKRRQGYMALVAFAGPLSNLIMALLGAIIYRAGLCFEMGEDFYFAFTYVMMYIVILNVGLAVFNLLPIMPLDGSRIFNWILPDKLTYKIENALSKVNPIVYLVIFFVVIRLLSTPLSMMEYALFEWILSGVDWVFRLFGL
jgi:Zn-dependent proteases